MHPAPIGRGRRLRPDTGRHAEQHCPIVASVAEPMQKGTAAESVRGKTRLTKPRRSRGRFAMAALGSGASFVLAAKAAGYNFSQLRKPDRRRCPPPLLFPNADADAREWKYPETLKPRQTCTARKAWWPHRSKLEKRSVLIPCGNALVW